MPTQIHSKTERKTSCKVTFTNEDKTIECAPHTNLRALAIENDIDLYNGLAKYTNCEGMGLCGTCTVEVRPPGGVAPKGAIEKFRFIQLKGNLRLACQASVEDDIEVTKHEGIYGTKGYSQSVTEAEIAKAYLEEGKTLEEISADRQLPTGKVMVLLDRAGVEVRKPGSAA